METKQVRTVRDALERHIDLRTAVGDYTLKRYRTSLDKYFGGPFGETDVADLTFESCAEWVHAVQAREPRPAPKTVKNQFGLLSSAMKTSVRLGLRSNNPCEGIRLPASQSTEASVRVLTRKEWEAIKSHLRQPYLLFFGFLLESGMRFSEATALTGTDFDYDHSPVLVNVSKAWKENARGRQVLGPPKTATSGRRIALSTQLSRKLWPLVEEAGSGLVFRNKVGRQIMSLAAHKNWSPACYAAGFTKENKPRIHALRHTSSGMFLQRGADMHSLSRRLGHKEIRMTVNVYGHLLPEEHRKMTQIADEIFG